MDKQEQLLEAAAKRFSLYGFRRAAVDDIARDAGIAKGSVYLHVQNKEELFRLTLKREHLLMATVARAAIEPDSDPCEAIRALTLRILNWLEERPLVGRMMVGDPELSLGPELARQIGEDCQDEQPFYNLIVELVERGVRQGLFRPDLRIEAAVTMIISIFHIHLHNKRQRFIDMEASAYMQELLRVLFEGILICERGTDA
jgi:AcrR family transcriptional regulator